ncbi:MAG: hypothetical protein AB8B55_24800 [Mariniblastus sp.]
MNHIDFMRIGTPKIVFVWDGTDRFVEAADRFVSEIPHAVVHSLLAMPHESLHSYSLFREPQEEVESFQNRLQQEYAAAIASTHTLCRRSRLEILFGDRVYEAVRHTQIIRATRILTPRFVQSKFSKWIHGDLNQRLVRKAACPVVFLNAESESSNSHLDQTMTKETG